MCCTKQHPRPQFQILGWPGLTVARGVTSVLTTTVVEHVTGNDHFSCGGCLLTGRICNGSYHLLTRVCRTNRDLRSQ
uniref:Putative secreted protein n=1 Tax=Anopheles marajoara TaxID=58244 RepID=A0A2M4CCG4_9DIPT